MITNKRMHGDELALVVAGLSGLGLAISLACSEDNSSSSPTTTSATATNSAATAASTDEGNGEDTTPINCEADATAAGYAAVVVGAAKTFLEALTEQQRSAVVYERTLANAASWSNFPTTFVTRIGVRLSDMSSEAQSAALALAEIAAGSNGLKLLLELRKADQFLVDDGKASATDYGRGLYYFSILGTPSTSEAWALKVDGHHLAYNFAYNTRCTSATPLFDGAEPMDWSDADGDHAPLEAQRAALVALLTSVKAAPEALLAGTFGDLVNGPSGGGPSGGGGPPGGNGGATASGGGGGDSKYPASLSYPDGTSGRGVAVASLSTAQKALVKTAIGSWVNNTAGPVAKALLDVYTSEEALTETYVGYTGNTDLTTQGSYFRIDGPRVWIEGTVQGGVVYKNVVHFHTIWRDKVSDYGAEFISQ